MSIKLKEFPGWEFTPGITEDGRETITITAPQRGYIDAATFREVPIGSLMRSVRTETQEGRIGLIIRKAGAVPRRPHGGDDGHRRAVAAIYRDSLWYDVPPAEVISKLWGVHIRTANEYITEARKHGHLDTHRRELEKARRATSGIAGLPIELVARDFDHEDKARGDRPAPRTPTGRAPGRGSMTKKGTNR